MIKSLISQVTASLTHLFYPALCESCNNDLNGDEKVLCLHCALQLPFTAFHLKQENKTFQTFIGRVPIEKATSLVFFTKDGQIQHLLHRFKYKGRKEIGVQLGNLLGTELKKCGWSDNIDIIVPVPLHKAKQHWRGYNQAHIFAEGIAAATDLKVCSDVLERSKKTATQTRKSRAGRVENVRDVFKLRKPDQLKNKHILLVDDVITTGATLEACALSLLQIEGLKVSIATIALATE
jgi:ComF family protein